MASPDDRPFDVLDGLRTVVYDLERGRDRGQVRFAFVRRIDPSPFRDASLLSGLDDVLDTALAELDPVHRDTLLADAARRIEASLAVAREGRKDLSAHELWERYGVRSAPLFDAASYCYSWVPAPWAEDVGALLATLRERFPALRVIQVKEKFGTLRLYYEFAGTGRHPEIDALIAECVARLTARGVHPLDGSG